MPAVSKAQQRFMGMVYAAKKGDMPNPSPEVAAAAASMKKKDAKDFASTKHKGLPEKKRVEEKIDLTDRRQMRRITDAEKRHKKQDARMKYGKNFKKFVKDAESAKNRLLPGEVKKWDKEKGRYVSNKE